MSNKIFIISKNEIVKNIKKPLFWFVTLFLPFFMILIWAITTYSTSSVEENIKLEATKTKDILVIDESNTIKDELIKDNFILIKNKEEWIKKVENNQATTLIIYPKNLLESQEIQIYTQTDNITKESSQKKIAENLLKQSILKNIDDEDLIGLYQSPVKYNIIKYKDWEIYSDSNEKYFIAFIWVVIYFFMMIYWNKYMLTTISEEKENRLIEVILTSVPTRDLIIWKILWWFVLIVIQIFVILSIPAIFWTVFFKDILNQLPINIWAIWVIDLFTIVFYVLSWFLIFSALMVWVWAAAPNAKEAWWLSSIFIVSAILPIYLSWSIITSPNGAISMFFSYFPTTAPMVLLFRNSIWELWIIEYIFSSFLIILYIVITFYVSFKIFELWAMEFQNRISLSKIIKIILRKNN